MPKRGMNRGYHNGGGSRFSSLKDYPHEHDDRDPRARNIRRVSFKQTAPQGRDNMGGMKRRTAEMALRSRLEDDDDMTEFATFSQFDAGRAAARRKGSPIPRGKMGGPHAQRKLIPNALGWYQVTINAAQRYSKDETIRALLVAISPEVLIPHYWHTEKYCVTFFVNDFNIAERLYYLERNIQMPDGHRLFVRVRNGTPIVSVDEAFKQRMKEVMAKRYNALSRALDMSKFHADPDFKDMFCGLFRTPVMTAALDIIQKNIPELEALNLNDNTLSTMEGFKDVQLRLPNLKILYLGDNKISSLAHLLVLRQVPLVELVLKGNPLCQRYKENPIYVSETRRKFPKLLKLDGANLAPRFLQDLQTKASFLCDAAGADIIRQFLEQYFIIFDSENRQPLLDAYHEQAMMSVSIPAASQAGRLNAFWKFNRNLRRIIGNDENYKVRQLKFGRLAVVSTLAEWPKTQHDPQSFSVDLTLFTPKLISFTVAGLFKELDSNSSNSTAGDIRYFQRQFVLVPAGGGFCIRNELIFLTSATQAQARCFLKPPAPAAAIVTTAQVGGLQDRLHLMHMSNPSTITQIPNAMLQPNTTMPAVAALPTQLDDSTKVQMVQAMSAQSNMNVEWSRKCLEETNWNYNHAAFIFDKLQKESKIPPEAFVK